MKNFLSVLFVSLVFSITGFAQSDPSANSQSIKLAVVISTNDAETVWNAFRIANYAAGEKDSVSVFLMGKGVEAQKIKDKDFNVQEMMGQFVENGGKILACGTCLRIREMDGTKQCPVSSLSEFYELIKSSDKVLSF